MLWRTTRAASSTSIAASPSPPFPISSKPCGSIPCCKQQYIHFLGSAYLVAGKYEAAAAQFKERIRLTPKTDLSRAFLAVALGHLGEAEEASRVWRELMEINPKYSFAEHVGRLPFQHQADIDRLTEGIRRAGIPA